MDFLLNILLNNVHNFNKRPTKKPLNRTIRACNAYANGAAKLLCYFCIHNNLVSMQINRCFSFVKVLNGCTVGLF